MEEKTRRISFFGEKKAEYSRRKWYDWLYKGIIMVVFGTVTLIWPEESSKIIITLIGILGFAIGAYKLFVFFKKDTDQNKVMTGFEMFAGIIIGILSFAAPGFVGTIAVFVVGLTLIYFGVLETVVGFLLPLKTAGSWYKWVIALAGIVSITFGIIIISRFEIILWIISLYALLGGALLLTRSIIRKKHGKKKPGSSSFSNGT